MDSVQQYAILVREAIPIAVQNLELEDDDVMWRLAKMFRPVDEAGRDTESAPGAGASDWFAEWRIKVQTGGTLEGSKFGNTTMVTAGVYDELAVGQAINDLYPDPALAPLDAWVECRMKLKTVKGLIPLNQAQIKKRLMSETLDSVVTDAAEAATRLFRKNFTTQAWGDGGAALGRADGAATIAEGSVAAVSIKEGTPYRFTVGQKYVFGSHVAVADFGSSTRTGRTGDGASANTPSIAVCVGIRKKARTVLFESWPGEGSISVTDGDSICLYNMFDFTQTTVDAGSKAMEGVESLIIDTGTFPGALYAGTAVTVDNRPELQGFVDGDESSRENPTPEVVAELIDLMTDGGQLPPPTLVAERSLWTLWAQLEREAMGIQQVPQGGAFHANGGVRGPEVQHGEHTFARLNSGQCREGTIHGIAPDSWLKFMPGGSDAIKWFYSSGGISGAPTVFGPVTQGRQVSSLAQAPFDAYGQLGCTKPARNMRRIGFHSQRSLNAT
jgi:hypothetical protein